MREAQSDAQAAEEGKNVSAMHPSAKARERGSGESGEYQEPYLPIKRWTGLDQV